MSRNILMFLLVLVGYPSPGQKLNGPFIVTFFYRNYDKSMHQEEIDRIHQAHLEKVSEWGATGKLVAAGSFENGGGIMIFNSGDKNEVQSLLADDWAINSGNIITKNYPVKFKKGGICKIEGNFNMISYYLAKYEPNFTKETVRSQERLSGMHEEVLNKLHKGGELIAEASLGKDAGSFIIFSDPEIKTLIINDQAVLENYLIVTFHTLNIVDKSLCQ